MSVEKVKAYFAGFGMEDRVLEFPVSSATVAEAAAALHCEPCHIAKTLAFLVCGTPMVIVMAGDARIDNAKYKARFAKKAKMPTPDEVLTLIGHPVGGVCPFAVPENGQSLADGLPVPAEFQRGIHVHIHQLRKRSTLPRAVRQADRVGRSGIA